MKLWFVGLPLLAVCSAFGGPSASIPIEVHKDLVFLTVRMQGVEIPDMVFDSGSIRTVLDREMAKQVGVVIATEALTTGDSEKRVPVSVAENVTYELGGRTVDVPLLVVHSLEGLAKRVGRRVNGIIGRELMGRMVVEVDYPKRVMLLHAADKYQYAGNGSIVPLEPGEGLIITAQVKGTADSPPFSARFALDSGASGAAIVFWQRCPQFKELTAAATDAKAVETFGVGGVGRAVSGRIHSVQIGGITWETPAVRFNESWAAQEGDRPTCGNIGTVVFGSVKTIYDTAHSRLILEKPAP